MSATPTPYRVRRDLTSGPLGRTLFRLAAPLATAFMLRAFYNLVDAFWLGKVGETALAAPGVTMPPIFIVISVGMAFGMAGTALVSQYTGAGSHREADRAAGQTLVLLCAVALVLAAPAVVFAPQLLRLAQVPHEILPEATVYLRIVMLGLPFMSFAIAYGSILRALGDTITPLIINVITNAVNLVLDPILIFGLLGMPRLEVKGAAIVTLISHAISALACYYCLRRRRAGLHVTLADLKPDWPMLRRALRIGLPLAVSNGLSSFGFMAFQVMINLLGTTVIGAMAIGFRVIWFFNVPAHAMSMAAAPVVGQALGAGKARLARRAVGASVALIALVMLVPTVLLIWRGQLVARAFIDSPDVIAEAGRFFTIVPASSYFFGVLMVLMAAFYGSGHTMPAMVISIMRLWLFRLPAGFLLAFVFGWGSRGVYTGMVVGNVLCALIALCLFLRGGWQTAVVPSRADEPEGAAANSGEQ